MLNIITVRNHELDVLEVWSKIDNGDFNGEGDVAKIKS